MQKASASIRYICMIYVANASIAIRSLTSEMKPLLIVFFSKSTVSLLEIKPNINSLDLSLNCDKMLISQLTVECTFHFQGELPFPSVSQIVTGTWRFRKNVSVGRFMANIKHNFDIIKYLGLHLNNTTIYVILRNI